MSLNDHFAISGGTQAMGREQNRVRRSARNGAARPECGTEDIALAVGIATLKGASPRPFQLR